MEGTSAAKKSGSKALKGLLIALCVAAGLFLVGFICCNFIW